MKMILMKTGSYLLLFILGVSAETTAYKGSPEDTKNTPITKLSKVSEFYIGDLLRTGDKEDLKTSSTIEYPISSTPEYAPTERSDNLPESSYELITNYKIHGGHDYSGQTPIPLTHLDGSSIPGPLKRMGHPPVNVFEKFLIQQSGVLERNVMSSEGELPISRRFTRAREYPQHKSGCKKHHHSSEEEAYSADERRPHRARLSHPDNSGNYRSTPSSYYPEDDHHSSHSSGSSQPSRSKSYDSSTNSQSGASYTRSKSSSKSQTVAPKNRPQKVLTFDNRPPIRQNGNRGYQEAHGNEGVVVYKDKDASDSEQDSYSDEDPSHGAHPHSSAEQGTQYSENYPPQTQTQGYQNPNGQTAAIHSQRPDYNHRPPHYVNRNYPNSKPQQAKQHSYSAPPVQGHVQKYQPDSHDREQPVGQYRESTHATEQPIQNHRGREQHNAQSYPVNQGSGRQQHVNRHQYQQDPHPQSPRHRNLRPQSNSRHPTEPRHHGSTYESNRQIIRPSEAVTQEYAYRQAPVSNVEGNRNYQARKIPSSRATRSSSQPAVQGRSENPQILISKANDSPVSRSVSYSKSSHNLDEPIHSPLKPLSRKQQSRTYEEPQKMTNPLLPVLDEHTRYRGYQPANKPYNLDYPVSYVVDQGHNGERNIEPQSYEEPHQPYGGPRQHHNVPDQSYEEPHHPYNGPHQPYEPSQPDDDQHQPYDDTSEQEGDSAPQVGHKVVKSDITGYKDEYAASEPLELDDEFFEKYGISKKAKIIVATAMEPNLFVADGSKLKEGGSNNGPNNEEYQERGQNSEESYQEKPKQFAPPEGMPGSFTELVDTNPKFLRKFSTPMRANAREFPDQEPTLDDLVFRSGLGDPQAFVKSQGTRQIVQQHGNGVSRIIFNHPSDLSKAESSETSEKYEAESESRTNETLQTANSEKVKNISKAS